MVGSKVESAHSVNPDSGCNVAFSPQALLARLSEWPTPRRYVALVSGGCDSMVLLHTLAAIRDELPAPIACLHFDHGLARQSGDWLRFVESRARSLAIPFFFERLDLEAGAAAETRAREARYARLEDWMQPEDGCLSAHHGDDQAETFLLHALRGSGMAGLAAMPEWTAFGPGWLARPLLAWTRTDLQAWAAGHHLEWVEDPANQDLSVPRNWLRARIWPALTEYWPAAARTLGRAAGLAADADALLNQVAGEDLRTLRGGEGDSLAVASLLGLSAPRRRNVLRYWLREQGLPVPTARKLLELETAFVLHDPGGRAVVNWPGACVRRYRDRLFAHPPWPPVPAGAMRLVPGQALDLGRLGRITLCRDDKGPLDEKLASHELSIRFRDGGERLHPAGDTHHRTLKHLLQDLAVLPWMRGRLPLLYAGEELVAVAGVVEASARFAGTGWRLDWSGAPTLH